MASRTLVNNGIIVSMDPAVGTLRTGAVLIEGDRIVQVAAEIDAGDCDVIDATGKIVLPGLIDAHRHLWYAPVRGDAMDGVFKDLVTGLYPMVAAEFTAEDLYNANRAGIAVALSAGITTVFDWCHVLNSADHAIAAVQAHLDMPARAIFGYGASMSRKLSELGDGAGHRDSWSPARALRQTTLADDRGRITMALAIQGPDVSPIDVVAADVGVARELGVPVSMHIGTGGVAKFSIRALADAGLLATDMQFVHCCNTTDEELRLVAEAGARIVVCPSCELMMGTGLPPTARVRAAGIRPAFGTDAVIASSSDMFEEARMGLASTRLRGLEGIFRSGTSLTSSGQLGMTSMDALRAITIDAAAACGLDNEIGSLTPGKQADLITLRAEDPNLWPTNRVVPSLIGSANGGNVETVIIAGQVIRDASGFTGFSLPSVRQALERTRDRLFSVHDYAGYEPERATSGRPGRVGVTSD
jgi:cytosine/adenosine deaminase-related metal-dependent hydrolase